MTETQKAAMQQALEALTPWADSDTVQYAAYHALRAALAEPEPEPVTPPARRPLKSNKDRLDQKATYVEGYGYVDTRAVRAVERAHGITGDADE